MTGRIQLVSGHLWERLAFCRVKVKVETNSLLIYHWKLRKKTCLIIHLGRVAIHEGLEIVTMRGAFHNSTNFANSSRIIEP